MSYRWVSPSEKPGLKKVSLFLTQRPTNESTSIPLTSPNVARSNSLDHQAAIPELRREDRVTEGQFGSRMSEGRYSDHTQRVVTLFNNETELR
jgi:hypothetical protein